MLVLTGAMLTVFTLLRADAGDGLFINDQDITPYPSPLHDELAEPIDYTYKATTRLPEIDESIIERTLYVLPTANNVVANGSRNTPFTTINAAIKAVHASLNDGVPTKLVLGPGLYRENIAALLTPNAKSGNNWRNTLFVLEGSVPGEVILSGSIEHDGELDFRPNTWQHLPGEKNIYVHDWPYPSTADGGPWMNTFGFALLTGPYQRSESIWINGQPLLQKVVESYRWHDPDGSAGLADQGTGRAADRNNQPGQLVFNQLRHEDPATALSEPWTFCVYTDEQAPAALRGKVFIRLPDGVTIDSAGPIEVARWNGAKAPLLNVQRKHNFVLRNLVLQHNTQSMLNCALNIERCQNFILEDIRIAHNAAGGLRVQRSERGAFYRVAVLDNGAIGISNGNSRQLLYEDCEASFNNYRGGWSGWLSWHPSGFKSGGVHNVTKRRFVAVGNYANGLWYDVYCTNVLVEDSLFYGNRRMGLMFELTQPNGGPHVARNCIFASNDNCGVYITMAANTSLLNSIIVNNGGGGRNFVESEPKNTQLLYKFRDHPHGPNSPEEWESVIVHGNIFATLDPASSLIDYLERGAIPMEQYGRVLHVLNSNFNEYWCPDPERAFRLPDGLWTNFEGWQDLQFEYESPSECDLDSFWENPGLDPNERAEFTTASNSALTQRARRMGVPLPEARIAEYWRRVDTARYDPPYLHYQKLHD